MKFVYNGPWSMTHYMNHAIVEMLERISGTHDEDTPPDMEEWIRMAQTNWFVNEDAHTTRPPLALGNPRPQHYQKKDSEGNISDSRSWNIYLNIDGVDSYIVFVNPTCRLMCDTTNRLKRIEVTYETDKLGIYRILIRPEFTRMNQEGLEKLIDTPDVCFTCRRASNASNAITTLLGNSILNSLNPDEELSEAGTPQEEGDIYLHPQDLSDI